jgi:hypothetical protein
MNRPKLLLTLLVAVLVALAGAQQEDIRPEMRPELKAHENKIDVRLIMSPQEFQGAGLHKLTHAEIESLNLWVEDLLVEMREKMDQHIQEARPIPAKPAGGAKTQRKPAAPAAGK